MSRKGGAKERPSDRSCIGPSLTLEEHEITRAKALPRHNACKAKPKSLDKFWAEDFAETMIQRNGAICRGLSCDTVLIGTRSWPL